MARAEQKEPGRLKTMWQIFQVTRKNDKAALPLILLALLLPIAVAVVLCIVFLSDNVLFFILWVISGVLVGVLLAMMTLTRRAEAMAYAQIDGQPGAVGAVLKNGLRGAWRTSEMPVAVNTKTQDAVYRAVGRAGVVLIGEGPDARTSRMIADEERKVKRIVPNVPISVIRIGPDSEISIGQLPKRMRKLKRSMTRAEVAAISNRLTSLGGMNMPIPKGIDPRRVRAGKPR